MKPHIKIYKEITGLNWSSRLYHVHHLDGNNKNNHIDNLLLIPKDLHHRYHFYKTSLPSAHPTEPTELGNCAIYHWATNMRGYVQALEEMQRWMDYKCHCVYGIPNLHGLSVTLEDE